MQRAENNHAGDNQLKDNASLKPIKWFLYDMFFFILLLIKRIGDGTF